MIFDRASASATSSATCSASPGRIPCFARSACRPAKSTSCAWNCPAKASVVLKPVSLPAARVVSVRPGPVRSVVIVSTTLPFLSLMTFSVSTPARTLAAALSVAAFAASRSAAATRSVAVVSDAMARVLASTISICRSSACAAAMATGVSSFSAAAVACTAGAAPACACAGPPTGPPASVDAMPAARCMDWSWPSAASRISMALATARACWSWTCICPLVTNCSRFVRKLACELTAMSFSRLNWTCKFSTSRAANFAASPGLTSPFARFSPTVA